MRVSHAVVAAVLALGGCDLLKHRSPAPSLHYVIGPAYQADGVWHYPRAQFDLDETGLAVATTRNGGLTADGEAADRNVLAAAHPSLQLPALARVTNLDTGRQVLVRVNDRGPVQRGRAIALTPRAIALLGGAGRPAFRVRIQVLEAESRQLAAQLGGADGPVLAVRTAPHNAVQTETLAPPPGVSQSAPRALPADPHPQRAEATTAAPPIPLRLPEHVAQVSPHPGALFVELATFSRLEYAELLRRRSAFLGAETSTDYDAPRERAFRVRIGPLTTVADADAALLRALRAGMADARIVAE